MEIKNDFSKQVYFVVLCIGIVTAGFVLKMLSTVVLPVIFAVMLAFVLMPLVRKLKNKFHIPWIVGSLLVMILSVIVVIAILTILFNSVSSILSQYSKYESRFLTIYKIAADNLNLEFDESKSFIQNMWGVQQVRNLVQNFALTFSTALVTLGRNLFMVFLLEAFFLIEMRHTQKKINMAFDIDTKGRFLRISTNVVQEVVQFLSIKFFISIATGLLIGFGTWGIGMDFPVIWGFLAFIMNFIPTFGSIISTLFTTLFAILQFYPSIWQTVYVFLLMLTVNMVLGNIVEPKIEGEGLGLSPFVILVSLTLWGYIWGFMGMLLAVPMTVIVKIICENVTYLRIIAVFLGNGNENPKKTSFSKINPLENL